MNILIGFTLSFIISTVAYKKKSLDITGYISALFIGTLLYIFGTYIIFTLLMVFFISSSVITKIGGEFTAEKDGRNAVQVLANSVVALFFSIMFYISNNDIYLIIASVAIASSNADTWGSEIGKLSKGKVVSITTFKEIKKGESGGISFIGTLSSLLGGLLIGFIYTILTIDLENFSINSLYPTIFISVGGLVGSLLDSYLGIIVQEKYKLSEDNRVVEVVTNRSNHLLVSGIPYFNNDVVNFLSTTLSSIIFYIWLITI